MPLLASTRRASPPLSMAIGGSNIARSIRFGIIGGRRQAAQHNDVHHNQRLATFPIRTRTVSVWPRFALHSFCHSGATFYVENTDSICAGAYFSARGCKPLL